jgi:hypothetical protein
MSMMLPEGKAPKKPKASPPYYKSRATTPILIVAYRRFLKAASEVEADERAVYQAYEAYVKGNTTKILRLTKEISL